MSLPRPFRAVACLIVLGTVLAGCSEGTDPDTTTTSPTASAPDGASPSDPTPSSPPSESAGTETADPSPAGPSPSVTVAPGGSTPRSRLLAAGELPGFNTQFRWREGTTGPEDPSASFATCQKFSVLSIGAEQAVVRRYRPAGRSGPASTPRAGELVATFPDAATARRAFAVLQAWHRDCAQRLERWARRDVGTLTPVPVDGGTAAWSLLTYGPVPGDPDASWFDAQGMVRSGARIALVTMAAPGQDYNYARGEEPMVAAVQRAAQKLS